MTGRRRAISGAWESSGIVDASAAFGRGAFLIDVQAHTLWIEKAPGDDNFGPNGGPPDGQPDFTYKREGGQLALHPDPAVSGSAGAPRGAPPPSRARCDRRGRGRVGCR